MRGAAMRQALDIRSAAWRWQGVTHRYLAVRRDPTRPSRTCGGGLGWGSRGIGGVSHRHLAVPHRRADRQAFRRVDDGVGVDAVVAVEVADGASLAELLDTERLHPVSAHAAEPAERCRMAVDHGHDAAVARQWRQQLFDVAEIL